MPNVFALVRNAGYCFVVFPLYFSTLRCRLRQSSRGKTHEAAENAHTHTNTQPHTMEGTEEEDEEES